jgi:hypothetical protein
MWRIVHGKFSTALENGASLGDICRNEVAFKALFDDMTIAH